MTNSERIVGQLFIVGFHGYEPSPEIIQMIHDYRIGGVILFARNIKDAEQLSNLTNSLQKEAKSAGYKRPLLICMDQENGVIRRIEKGVSLLPGAMSISATGDPACAHSVCSDSGSELSRLGVNWDLAPDADVNNNPDNPVIGTRSFGDDPYTVAKYVQAAVEGFQSQNVAACLKHFPGHGNTSVDSHLGLPVINRTLADLKNVELIPFVKGIESGVASIMAAHIMFSALDSDLPASLSEEFLRRLLRDELGYEGLVVTDDLEMLAIANHYGTENACVTALENGADMVMVSHTPSVQIASIKAVAEAYDSRRITVESIRSASKRIQQMKLRFANWNSSFNPTEFATMVKSHQARANRIYEHSVTAVKTTLRLNPQKRVVVISLTNQRLSNVVDIRGDANALVAAVRHQTSNLLSLSLDVANPTCMDVLNQIDRSDAVIVATTNVKSSKDPQAVMVRNLLKITPDVAVIAVRNPYDMLYLPAEIATYIATFENTAFPIDIAVRSLYGKVRLSGHLPISLR